MDPVNNQNNDLQKVEKHKSGLITAATFLLIFAIIGIVIELFKYIAPILVVLPILLLWMFWLLIVVVVSILTLCIIWASDKWKSFVNGYADFNKGFSNSVNEFVEAMQKIAPIIYSVVGACVLALFVISLISYLKDRRKGTLAMLIISCVLVVVDLVLVITRFI